MLEKYQRIGIYFSVITMSENDVLTHLTCCSNYIAGYCHASLSFSAVKLISFYFFQGL